MPERPVVGTLEERSEPISVEGQRIRGLIPFGVESRTMPGGWREVISPRALDGANLDDLIATVEHRGLPLGRYPTTLSLESRSDGVQWSVDPPRSRADVIEAVQRGDLRSGSWRMRVAADHWDGDVRHIDSIAELRDVALTATPAYPTASVEMRSREEGTVPEETRAPVPEENETETTESTETTETVTETRSAPENAPDNGAGRLRVGNRTAARPRRGLTDEFRHLGFPSERAVMPWEEFEERAVTWSASVDSLGILRRDGGPLGADVRYAWTAFPRVGVGSDITSVQVVQQTARALADPADTVRAIADTSTKPETGSTVNIVPVSMKQVAGVQSGIPNIYLQQPVINSVVETDLRLSINEGLDSLVLAGLATAGHQDPTGLQFLGAVRKALTTLRASGYNANALNSDS